MVIEIKIPLWLHGGPIAPENLPITGKANWGGEPRGVLVQFSGNEADPKQ
jgi:hypothetical protein